MLQKRALLLLTFLLISVAIASTNNVFTEAFNNSELQAEAEFINQVATDFTVQDVDSGTIYSLGDFEGKIVVLDLFATWCPPCKISIPYLRQIYTNYSRSDLQIISVDVDDTESQSLVSQFRSDEQMDWIVSLDPESIVIDNYGRSSIPTFYIIDQQGNIEWSTSGFSEEDTWPVMESTIKRLMEEDSGSGNPTTPQSSKVFFTILKVVAGLAAAAAVVFGVFKLQGRFRVKTCSLCGSAATSKCAKCGMIKCDSCSVSRCSNCGSRQFLRL